MRLSFPRAGGHAIAGRLVLSLLLASPAVQACATVPDPAPEVAAGYVKPQQLIDVGDGRRINLYCTGSGSPTVVFDSGLSDWSSTWALIQPTVAKATRACSYDRPGMGYSDPAPGPHTPAQAVEDLARLLDGAGIDGPVVLVGHSLGGFHAKLFAATHPGRVAGLVLVDPSEERMWERVTPLLDQRLDPALVRAAIREDEADMARHVAHFHQCAAWSRAGELTDERYDACTDPVRRQLGQVILTERRRLQPRPEYMEAQAAELAGCMYVPEPIADARYEKLFSGAAPLHDMPMLVLTHGLYDMSEATSEALYLSWRVAHELTAGLSTRGSHRMVPDSTHNMQVDSPDAVADAIIEVLGMARGAP